MEYMQEKRISPRENFSKPYYKCWFVEYEEVYLENICFRLYIYFKL